MESVHEIDTREVLACDESFFAALLAADHDLLGTILADDFVIIDVLSGQVARREELLGADPLGAAAVHRGGAVCRGTFGPPAGPGRGGGGADPDGPVLPGRCGVRA